MIKQRYDIYLNTESTGILHAADCVIEEENAELNRVGFRYTTELLEHPAAFSLDPRHLPLQSGELILNCRRGVPGLLDDYLPDAWGLKVLRQLAFYRNQKKANSHSIIEALALIGGSRIGALSIVPQGQQSIYEAGISTDELKSVETAAQQIDRNDFKQVSLDERSLLYLAGSGSGVGGARPKALVYNEQQGQAYLAKFNRLHSDLYNNARVELACLKMANAAGLNVAQGYIEYGINGREVLFLKRFDISDTGSRKHLITVNALLKEKNTQRDSGTVFRYNDIYTLLQKYSISIEGDLQQLLRLMMFNCAINNLDDHERNFSLINNGEGYQLSPAYDLLPSLITGQYHIAGYDYSPDPPRPTECKKMGRLFGLSKSTVAQIAEEVIEAVRHWSHYAEKEGLTEEEQSRISAHFRL